MKKLTFSFCIILFSCFSVSSQNFYLVEVLPESGSYQFVSSALPGVDWLLSPVRTIDEDGDRFFALQSGPGFAVVTLDLNSGSLLNSADITGNINPNWIRGWRYNPADGLLYAFIFDDIDFVWRINTVDPVTGVVTAVSADFPIDFNYTYGNITFDPIGQRIIALYPAANKVLIYNISDNTINHSPALSMNEGISLSGIRWHRSNQELFGSLFNSGTGNRLPGSINLETGTVDEIGIGAEVPFFPNKAISIDENNDVFYVQGGSDLFGYWVYGLDLISGELLYNANIIPPSTSSFGFNVTGGIYSSSNSKLYGLHFGNGTIGVNESNGPSEYLVYPNPVNDVSLLNLPPVLLCDGKLNVFGVNGQLAKSLSLMSGGLVEIRSSDFAPGIYTFEVCSDQEVIGFGRFLIK